MDINLSKHSIKRARKRFRLNRSALFRMCTIALTDGIKRRIEKSLIICYGHFRFVFFVESNGLVLATVTNLDDRVEYKKEKERPLYIKGCRTKKNMIIRNE